MNDFPHFKPQRDYELEKKVDKLLSPQKRGRKLRESV